MKIITDQGDIVTTRMLPQPDGTVTEDITIETGTHPRPDFAEFEERRMERWLIEERETRLIWPT